MNNPKPTAELGFTIYQDTFEYPKKGEKVMSKKTGGAAFPRPREYAAIHLRIPDSGTPWLDKMIARAERRDIAAKVFQAVHAQGIPWDIIYQNLDTVVTAMLRAKETI